MVNYFLGYIGQLRTSDRVGPSIPKASTSSQSAFNSSGEAVCRYSRRRSTGSALWAAMVRLEVQVGQVPLFLQEWSTAFPPVSFCFRVLDIRVGFIGYTLGIFPAKGSPCIGNILLNGKVIVHYREDGNKGWGLVGFMARNEKRSPVERTWWEVGNVRESYLVNILGLSVLYFLVQAFSSA